MNKTNYRSSWKWLLIAALAFVIWNGPLLWSVSKPYLGPSTNEITVAATSSQETLPDSFIYPRLKISVPLHDNPASSPMRQQDWGKIAEDLHDGVSLAYATTDFEKSPLVYVTGHSSDLYPHPYSSVFAPLVSEARIGDRFAIVRGNKVYQYEVVEQRVADPTDLPAFTVTDATSEHRVALLVTCAPLGTNLKRSITIAKQVNQ